MYVTDEVKVDEKGFIEFGTRNLTQAEAVDLAIALVQAVQDSVWRNQPRTTQSILERRDSRTGVALKALRDIYGSRA